MKSSIMRSSFRVKFLAVLTVLAMAFAALAFCPADTSDADNYIRVYSWDDMKKTIESAPSGKTIIVDTDFTDHSGDDNIYIDGKELYIDLDGHWIDRARGTPDGDDGRLFKISGNSEVYIGNGTLKGGHGDDAGCILVKGGSQLHLQDLTICDNYSSDDGGAIWADDSTITIHNCNFTNNSCNDNGGAIYLEGNSAVHAEDSTFSNNFSDDDGGALYSNECGYNIINCIISKNHAGGNGGAYYADGDNDQDWVSFSKTSFSENHADKNGGAIYNNKESIVISSCTFDGNYCATYGGAIYSEGGELDIEYRSTDPGEVVPTVFKNNNAPDSGGSLALFGTKCEVKDTVHENNHANACGGAIYISDDSDVTITNATFTGNNVLMDGGAVLVGEEGSKVTIAGKIVVKDNKSERNGPNVFIRSGNKLICNKLEDGSTIGVVLADGENKFTERFGENNPGVDPTKTFFSDDQNYYVGNDNGDARMYKSGTGGDMSDNLIWIIVGVIAAILVVAVVVYVMKTRKSNAA